MNKYSPGAACDCDCVSVTDPCVLLDDPFARADSGDPGSDWVEEVGGGDISSGTLVISIGTSQVICSAANPDGANTIITVDFKLSGTLSSAKIFLGWLDSSNFLYCTISRTTITVGENGGLSNSETLSTLSTGTYYSATVCYNGEVLVGRVSGMGEVIIGGLTAPGDRHGLGCGNNTVTFDNFLARKVSEDCEVCTYHTTIPCEQCETGDVPRFWRLDISGVVTGTNPIVQCTSGCSDINGTWIIDIDTLVSHGDDESTGHLSCGGEIEGPELTGCAGFSVIDGFVWIALHAAWFLNGPPYQRDTRVHINAPFSAGGYTLIYFSFHRWGTAVAFNAPTPVIPCEDAAMIGLVLDPTTQDNACDFSSATFTLTPLS